MKHNLNYSFFVMSVLALLITGGCGPIPQVLYVDSSVPAENPVNLQGKSVSLFVSVDSTDYNGNNFISFNDSLHMVSLANGIVEEMEKQLSMQKGAILVFNHYPHNDRTYDLEYIQDLSFVSNSDLVLILDSLSISIPELVEEGSSSYANAYQRHFAASSLFTDFMVFDGFTADMLQQISRTDTVYWELLTRSDIREESIINRVNSSLDSVIESIGTGLAKTMFPSWREQERMLYTFNGEQWWRAYDYAVDFRWKEAMDIWLSFTEDSNSNIKIAAAAFNLAVACELTNRRQLAVEWLELSLRNHALRGTEEYKQYLQAQIEKEQANTES